MNFSRLMRLAKMLPPALGVALPGLGRLRARRRWPRAAGEIALAGLSAPVEIVRDRWGVPHIFAASEHDLFFAQGYVHGQDRMWQMDIGRRVGDGELASVIGPMGVPTDKLIRTLGLRRHAELALASLDADSRKILDAYADGVNARIAEEPLPLETSFFGVTPAPWSAVDSLVRGNVLALILGGNHRLELLRAQIIAEAGDAAAADLLPPHAPDTATIVPGGLRGLLGLAGLDGVDRMLGDPNIVSGSNNWVVSGERTASGKPLLANDVHLGLGMPSAFHECGLHGGRFDVVGFGLPGVPMIVLGHNGRIAWGLSNLGPDTQDFYVERVEGGRYEYQGSWRDLEVRREDIPVRGGEPVTLAIRSTVHGPIMNEVMDDVLKDVAEPMALRWALHDTAPLPRALVGINLATGWESFRAAAALWESPGQNFVYADTDGNIGYQATGKVPVRSPGHDGTTPMPGWTGAHEWTGFIPFAEMPTALNPEVGYLATANNKITDDGYPHLISANWFPGYRARRITELLAGSRKHTVDSMVAIQRDTRSLPAEAIVPHLLQVVPSGPLETRALAEVRAWDLRFEADRAGAVIFQTFYVTLLRRVVEERLGKKLAARYLAGEYERHGSMHMPHVIGLLASGAGTAHVAPAFAEAVAWLAGRFGQDPRVWTWGRAHQVTWRHSTLGRTGIGWLERVWNAAPYDAAGDNYTVDGASFTWNKPYDVIHGTVLRMVIDLGDLSRSRAVIAPGQSEHLHHPHRMDQLDLFRRGDSHPLLHTRAAVNEHAESTLVLRPGRS